MKDPLAKKISAKKSWKKSHLSWKSHEKVMENFCSLALGTLYKYVIFTPIILTYKIPTGDVHKKLLETSAVYRH